MTNKKTQPAADRIQAIVDGQPIVLFMKGTPQYPMCGYSSRAVRALEQAAAGHEGAGVFTVNVLEEPEIRANLPRYSNWPTFPQLFIHGELIGGCDITLELLESGELPRIFAEAVAQ
ncbi:MAG: Grx4 family monothiol glutaredoxin [Pseudoxanthomonas sp.]